MLLGVRRITVVTLVCDIDTLTVHLEKLTSNCQFRYNVSMVLKSLTTYLEGCLRPAV